MTPAGPDETTYEACTTITTKNFDETETTSEVCHDVVIKNPCINTAYVTIDLPATLPGGEYVVESGPMPFDAIAADQQELVNALPTDHDLCGAIVCVDKYMGNANDESVVTWNQDILTWTVSTDDRTLIDHTRTFSLECEFASYPKATYPTATSDTSTGIVDFIDPCIEDFTVTAESQTAFTTSKFDDTEISTIITPFTVVPSSCPATYYCDSVRRVDAEATDLDCTDFAVDGELLGGVDDGKISITITEDDYINEVYKPGVFKLNLCATVSQETPTCEEIEVELVDPCDPPTSLDRVDMVN